jgi:quercetin dioxygenase-like cupin family protein
MSWTEIAVVMSLPAWLVVETVLDAMSRTDERKGNAMNRFGPVSVAVASSLLVLTILGAARSPAQMSGFAAKPMLQSTVEGAEAKEAVMLAITIAPGGSSGRHTHPGDCYGTVVEGAVELRVEGREPRRVSPGEAWHNPRGVVHELRNVGDGPLRVVNTLLVDKGKPRMQPVQHGHLMIAPAQLAWTDNPPALMPGAKIAVIQGDPSKAGPYAYRLKLPADYRVMPHRHPADEHLTVLSGTFYLAVGERFAPDQDGRGYPAGGFLVMPAGTAHYAWTNEETIVQVHGVGPSGITYVNPADDPRKK